jgi:hypothetical protein
LTIVHLVLNGFYFRPYFGFYSCSHFSHQGQSFVPSP